MPLLPALPTLAQLAAAAAAGRTPIAPRCFAYDARAHVFACVGHNPIYNAPNVGGPDQATNLRIDAIGPARADRWTLAALTGPTTPRRTVERALAGFARLRAGIALPAGAWTRAGDLELDLDVTLHEGDVSTYYVGDLRARCSSGAEVALHVRKDLGVLLGETARAYASPDGAWIAVSIAGDDGGEETAAFRLDTIVIDAEATCRTGAPVTFPAAARARRAAPAAARACRAPRPRSPRAPRGRPPP